MGHESRIIAVAGQHASEAAHLPEIGTRVLALLRELAAHRVSYVRLQFEAGAILGAMIGRHCLFAFADGSSDDALLAVIDEVRAILADHDLAAIPTDSPPPPEPEVAVPEVQAAQPVARTPPPVGARYRGASSAKATHQRRRPFGR